MATFLTKDMLYRKATFTCEDEIATGDLKEALIKFAIKHNSPNVFLIKDLSKGNETLQFKPYNTTWTEFADANKTNSSCNVKLFKFSGCAFTDLRKAFCRIPLLDDKNKKIAAELRRALIQREQNEINDARQAANIGLEIAKKLY